MATATSFVELGSIAGGGGGSASASVAATPAVLSQTAGASLSMGDANFDGVKHHDINKVDELNQAVTRITAGVCAATIITACIAMLWEASIVAYVAFSIPLITAPAVVIQRKKIQWLPSTFWLSE